MTIAQRFLDLHRDAAPLLMPNPWDRGTAVALQGLGFRALATTSAGFAATLARLDGAAGLDAVVAHAAELAAAVEVPVSCDFENAFAHEPDGVARHVERLLAESSVAGFSIEDYGGASRGIYALELAVERVVAAVERAHDGVLRAVVTARTERHLHGAEDLGSTIARLQRFQEAGADVLFAPGLVRREDIRAVVQAVDRPVNVLALPGVPTVAELASLGVARVSVGSGFALAAFAGLRDAALELRERGSYDFWQRAERGAALREGFTQPQARPAEKRCL